MQRYEILHRTYYNFSADVRLGPHQLLLRPRTGHDLRVESALLVTSPLATVRWHRDAEDNTVAIAVFEAPTRQLLIESRIVVEQYNEAPLDFVVADYAAQYPFNYTAQDEPVLRPYMQLEERTRAAAPSLDEWVATAWQPNERIETYALLERLASKIQRDLSYRLREEPGVQTVAETLHRRTGSCRDSAFLFMEVARRLGLAARFVSGYTRSPPSTVNFGSTHAWAEIFLPGAGWKGFDPTAGKIVGSDHFAVAVARLPETVPPIAGSFSGPSGSSMDVGVWVTAL